ncbi:MAG: parvulin peptidyl-prolyl isomerase [Isosphaeraceae bacterium]
MIAKDRGRKLRLVGLSLVVLAVAAAGLARAQQGGQGFAKTPPAQNNPTMDPQQVKDLRQINVPGVQQTRVPVSPSDPIAIVNNQIISRQLLADECVAREGKKILDVLINRTLIEQALARGKMSITAAEIDQEIGSVADRFGVERGAWLRTLEKERHISPAQYAREIIYPALALRKLCSDKVQVTDKDLQDAFESQYGDKIRCRMIMVDKQLKAMGIWEELHKNPGGFETMAKEQSMDPGSRSLGGLLAEPITRHAIPKTLTDKAFYHLVDGDPNDKDPTHKPKDGDFTGPIQASESVWVILRREEVIPAAKNVTLKDKRVHDQVYEMIYQVKLKEAMETIFQDLVRAASIENRLTGMIKMANEEKDPDFRVDGDVKLMGNRSNTGVDPRAAAAASASPAKLPPPVALSPEAAKKFRPLKPGGNPAPAPAPGAASTAPSSN